MLGFYLHPLLCRCCKQSCSVVRGLQAAVGPVRAAGLQRIVVLNKNFSIHRQQLNTFVWVSALACCSLSLSHSVERIRHWFAHYDCCFFVSGSPPPSLSHSAQLSAGVWLASPPPHKPKKQACTCVFRMKSGLAISISKSKRKSSTVKAHSKEKTEGDKEKT